MKPIIFSTRIDDRGMTPQSRKEMSDVYLSLGMGDYEWRVTKITKSYLTRYKYYFAYLLPEIIAAGRYVEINKETGEVYPMSCESFHDILKEHFNSNLATDPFVKGGFKRIPASTTKLSDGEFIDRFENEIAAHFQTELQVELWSLRSGLTGKRKSIRKRNGRKNWKPKHSNNNNLNHRRLHHHRLFVGVRGQE